MHQFVCQRALDMILRVEVVGTHDDAAATRDIAARHEASAWRADQVAGRDLAADEFELLEEKHDDGRIVEYVCLVALAALYIACVDLGALGRVRRRLNPLIRPLLEPFEGAHERAEIVHSHRSLLSSKTIMGRLRRSRTHHARRDVHRGSRTRVRCCFYVVVCLLTCP